MLKWQKNDILYIVMDQIQQINSSENLNQKSESQSNQSFYEKNRYKIFGLLLSITLVFSFIIISINIFLLSDTTSYEVGGSLILTLVRIAFLIFVTPVAIVLLFVGHRIDTARNKTQSYDYPFWVELVGIIVGIYLGLNMAILWIVILSVSEGTLWTDPLLYVPLPVITPLITYLCFKTVQLVYSLFDKRAQRSGLKLTLIVFIISLPIFVFSGIALYQIYLDEASEATITMTNFKEIPSGQKNVFTADLSVPTSDEYNITAYIGSKPSGTIRLNGIENIDGFNNFELTKGVNKLLYYPDSNNCTQSHISVTFQARKVLANQLKLGSPKSITETITCK